MKIRNTLLAPAALAVVLTGSLLLSACGPKAEEAAPPAESAPAEAAPPAEATPPADAAPAESTPPSIEAPAESTPPADSTPPAEPAKS
ncbi:hypothetical protein [Pseudoxanthomonas sp.]|uniref:hypothetical protein n=1 Tax=Pseudoxanthomonas sp. TaxID=1871049 RepID=UPI002609BBAC|nr:hypothetical protein [Pseudoxanthomonas sp.]WDS35554.1 MAG: hypothetical protein O8I58_14605 [Pseudoxanthomonas sp.]